MTSPRIEMIIVRDGDGPTEVTVYLDGRPAATDDYVIQAEACWTWKQWREQRDQDLLTATPDLRPDLLTAYDNPPDGEYIEDRDGTDWLADLPAVVLQDPAVVALMQRRGCRSRRTELPITAASDIDHTALTWLERSMRPGHWIVAHNHARTSLARNTGWAHVLYAAVHDPCGQVSMYIVRYRRTRTDGRAALLIDAVHETDGPDQCMRVTKRVLNALTSTAHLTARRWREAATVSRERSALVRRTGTATAVVPSGRGDSAA